MFKVFLAFLAGGGIGAGGMWIFAKKKYEKILDEQDADFIEKLKEHGIDVGEKDEPAETYEESSDIVVEYDARPKSSSEDVLIRGTNKPHVDVDYTSYFKGKDEDEVIQATDHPRDDLFDAPDDTWEENHYTGLEASKKDIREPKIIKEIDYGAEPGYSRMDLLYYQDSDTLTFNDAVEDIDDDAVLDFDEVESMLGDTLVKFGFKTNDEERIFVRNYERKVDYEINKMFGAYGEV